MSTTDVHGQADATGFVAGAAQDALDWLTGNLLPRLKGRRVLVATYNDAAWFGIAESPEFITRYQIEHDKIRRAPLNASLQAKEIEDGIQRLGAAIKELAARRDVVQLPTPLAYQGAAVLYGLPPQ